MSSFMDEMYKLPPLKPAHVLGRGGYGSVTLVRDPQSRSYAKKTSPINVLSNLLKELDIMTIFDKHPCIVRATNPMIHFEKNTNGETVGYIIMEYANKGTLEKMISEELGGKPLPEYMIQHATRMILQGLEALHAKGYVHCDIKPANLLLFNSGTRGEPFDLKLADFGLSKYPNTPAMFAYGSVGTPLYMSPESLWPNSLIEPARDIWSLGSVVCEMFGGKPQIREGDYFEWLWVNDISPVAKDFLRRCHEHISRRATAAELLKHPFITQNLSLPLLMQTRREQRDWMVIPKLPGSIW
ncbi:Mitogen-activated protein kinase kinase kinase 20 [Cardamine amara subsp. amara]|uniref:Mitogen-activated protein kinase kinase kinase 20 n=1 Tax=Cardamine amara subsp. amara TaxID=228776 RepID=A0ABD0ZCL2_CARAN